MEGRFWSGAAIVLTMVIAGASALPAFLLGAPGEAPVVMPLPRKVEAAVVAPPVPARSVTEVSPPAVAAPLSAVPPTVAPPAPAPAVLPPPAAAAMSPPAAPPTMVATEFPPVQPPSIDTATPAPAVPAKPARVQRPHEKAAAQEGRERKRPRPVRPAIYPLREFFAWRR